MTTELEKKSIIEKTSGNLVTEVGVAALAAFAGTPLAALLPVLSTSLANGRHKKRVENALHNINQMLLDHEQLINELSDSQYKIINEAVLTILQTTEEEKINFLKRAIETNIKTETVLLSYSSQITRILRDISAEEFKFLINNFQYRRILFDQEPKDDLELKVEMNSTNGILVTGLMAIGLIVPGAATWDDSGRYQFSPLVAKLLAVIGIDT